MTEEEAHRYREEKQRVSRSLAAKSLESYHLEAVDPRLYVYVSMVRDSPTEHNLWEQLAVERFLRMVKRYGLDARKVRRFYLFYESLYFPGKEGMQHYKLTPVQCFQFAAVYGFWEKGRRIVREVCLFVPRKFSKTTSGAAFPLYDLFFGDANAECYFGANSYDQAKKGFNVLRGCVRRLDPRGLRYTVNEDVIKSRRQDRTAFAQCLTGNSRTKDGLNASTVLIDEYSQARTNELLTVLTTSMGVRQNPLTVIITTASDVFEGPFYAKLQGYKRLLLGEVDDDSVFAHLFEPDVDDPEDQPATWRKVHPHMGVTVSLEFYEAEYRAARRDGAEAMLAFRTKLLNVYAEQQQRSWITATLATDIMRPFTLDAIKGRPDAMVAIDLSESDDFSAVTTGFYSPEEKSFTFHTAYFFPDEALAGHPNERLYRKWAAEGHLTLTQGPVINYRTIVDYVLRVNRSVRILSIGYDPWKSQELINMLAASGARDVLRGVKQTYGNFTAPVQSFEHGCKTGHIFINPNPINAYCFGNAILDTDNLGNSKPIKRARYQKIDGLITMLMCLRLFIDYER
jgi:phage terminase large subunit-like protein